MILKLNGHGMGYSAPDLILMLLRSMSRVVGRAWHGPPPDVVGDPLPLHCGQSYDYWEKKRIMFNTPQP